MTVQGEGRKRHARFLIGCAAFLMASFVMIYNAVPAYSSSKKTIPCFSVITVEPGQDLNALAKKYGTTSEQIMKDNPKLNTLKPGMILTIQENTKVEDASRGSMVSWHWPVLGPLSSDYGWRGYNDFHHGIDIAVATGTPVSAARAGRVVKAGRLGVYGLAILIDHGNGIQTLYGHNSQLLVKAGEQVESGERIAISGNTGNTTGPHLHFEIRQNGKTVDPTEFLPQYSIARQ